MLVEAMFYMLRSPSSSAIIVETVKLSTEVMMNKIICVYSSSSNSIDKKYFEAASELGKLIAENNDILLFGGGMRGLMGATARSVHSCGGKVIGVIPEALNLKGM